MTTIDELLGCMDRRLDRAIALNDPRGHFAAVYRAVTARVGDGIEAGAFDDGDRMERFDVTFAGRYLDAAEAHDAGRPCSRSWRTAFEHADSPLLVLQHVLLGMNAHINLDLGVAAAVTAPGDGIVELADDFERINGVLAEMVDRMQAALAVTSPWIGVVDRVGRRLDERLTSWSLEVARSRAWRFAEQVATARDPAALVDEKDLAVARLSEDLVRPRWLTRRAVAAARRRERADVAAVVGALRDQGAPLPSV